MNKKITRRAAMGTVIVGLVAGPFVVRALRQQRNLSEPRSLNEEAIRKNVVLARIAENSRLPVSDVEAVLSAFQAERVRCLRLRRLKAKASIVLEGQAPATNGKFRSVSESGVLSLQITEEQQVGDDQLPWNYHLRFDPDGGRESGEYFKFADAKESVVKGRKVELVHPSVLLDMVAAPFVFFACLWTRPETAETFLALDSWRLKPISPGKSIAEGFVFSPVDKGQALLPEVGFKEGCFSYIKDKDREGRDYCNTCEGMTEVSNYSYPSVFTSEMNIITEQINVKHSIRLDAMELTVV